MDVSNTKNMSTYLGSDFGRRNHILIPYYPLSWFRRDTDSTGFTWFLFGRPFRKDNILYLEVPKGATFYETSSGVTWVATSKINIIITPLVTDPQTKSLLSMNELSLHDISNQCERVFCSDRPGVICHGAKFQISSKNIRPTSKELSCELLNYARDSYPKLKELYPNFPSPAKIDRWLETMSCSEICQKIYTILYPNAP